ncbi:MAG: hypothetical protein WAN48_10745 [Actinomycetes bacterium]
MTPDALFRWMTRRRPEPAPEPVCGLCGGKSGHPPIPDDGALVCYPCLLREGRLASDPLHAPIGIVADTWQAHEDVVALRNCHKHGQCWQWIGWTHDADTLLDPGGAVMAYGEALIVARAAEAAGGLL